jgi:hypothetical protein
VKKKIIRNLVLDGKKLNKMKVEKMVNMKVMEGIVIKNKKWV